ncbi:GlsB/YeaQ/YmgE family stress response membrane protein [Mycobacterium sp. CPCC 205372]|uniref:GlsB/YeaQ/YmgE family stress response membrane protein n=1 Tax=Mycobacterium hippophais TaxID=3016340 RepID=A0ABT4Q184_9MYCO|nr:GlsB/YeaQ/YmgE family stress response membrane protein [Mycobacterium hippophais]MCZ8382608.1 GlsB/YeaQ/YmgE family stress response membrane protein [Mycobacterium hippophais]
MFWTIISAIIGGLIIGALARLVMPGKQNIGVIMTIVLGVLGSFIGSWACYNLFGYQNEGGGWAVIPFIVGIVVAAILIAIYLAVTGRKTRGTTVR